LLVDLTQTAQRLDELRPIVELPARNAGIQLVNGQVQTVPPVQGRVLDRDATLAALQNNASDELADGVLDLVMVSVAPAVTDASPLLAQAQALLSSPMSIEAYDPVDNQSQVWTLHPSEWGQWLLASQNPVNPLGLSLSLDQAALTTFLNQKSTELPAPKYLKVDESINAINATLATNNLNTWVRVYHEPTVYTVQAGETLSSIGYDNGIPYPWIQAANPDLGALNPGQQIILPSKDDLLPLPIVKNKRIVVSIPNQEMWAYENGQLLWNWLVSTGIARSPTAPGIFQIQSHDPNAFGAQWNLYMPHFMGVYHPGPGVEVMNGFHGFPTDASGGYLLWTSSLGRPATYGCILLSLENAEALYNWAEEGVVVEIQG
jgi:lipoprotein-anchoring transpeptidase ErfK/SrfK